MWALARAESEWRPGKPLSRTLTDRPITDQYTASRTLRRPATGSTTTFSGYDCTTVEQVQPVLLPSTFDHYVCTRSPAVYRRLPERLRGLEEGADLVGGAWCSGGVVLVERDHNQILVGPVSLPRLFEPLLTHQHLLQPARCGQRWAAGNGKQAMESRQWEAGNGNRRQWEPQAIGCRQ